MWPRLLLLFILGGLQGALGWYMVASGLVNRVDVSQYRLAAHLTLACVLFAAIIWTIACLDIKHRFPRSLDSWTALILFAMILIQIAAGGFVAGINAGQGYNTWPLMDGSLVPNGLLAMQPWWLNSFENALAVQFNHRILAYVIFALAAWQLWALRSRAQFLMFVAVLGQIALGISTLLQHVPLHLALAHQFGALVVLAAALWNLKVSSTSAAPCASVTDPCR